jgi:inorganic pyrophosphatase
MDISKITAGRNPPGEVHAVIEIPVGGVPVKYEMDKESGALFVDRFLHTSMYYPGNYGFIPHTLALDGDPLDILVIAPIPVVAGCVVRCRPVGALVMEDQAGCDEKIIAVPVDELLSSHMRGCRRFCGSRSRIFSRTTKIWKRASGRASGTGSGWPMPVA